jgi:tripartite ATP-independent transporter DctM subunit
MSPVTLGVIGIAAVLLLMALRMQIGFAMAVIGFLGFAVLNSFPSAFSVLGHEPFKTAGSYGLSVIPLFMLMGQFAFISRMGAEAYKTLYYWIGFLPGGLAMATIGACSFFAAISGSSLATAATMGMVALPEMRKFKYSDELATGCLAAGGTLGILIPPSTVLMIYGILTQQSIAELFIAGFIPGIILSLLFILTIYITARVWPEQGPPGPRFTFPERVRSLKEPWGIFALFLLVIGGLYAGWFTPTEAAAVGAFGAFLITLIKGRLTWKTLVESLMEASKATGMIFGILIGAYILQYFLTISQITDHLVGWVVGMGLNRYIVMCILIVIYLILGCLMEGLSIIILTIPITYPLILKMGFDPIWFGVMITVLIEMGLITPPVGVNVFVIAGVAKDVPMYRIFRGIVPFIFAMLVLIALLLIFPQMALYLPHTMSR